MCPVCLSLTQPLATGCRARLAVEGEGRGRGPRIRGAAGHGRVGGTPWHRAQPTRRFSPETGVRLFHGPPYPHDACAQQSVPAYPVEPAARVVHSLSSSEPHEHLTAPQVPEVVADQLWGPRVGAAQVARTGTSSGRGVRVAGILFPVMGSPAEVPGRPAGRSGRCSLHPASRVAGLIGGQCISSAAETEVRSKNRASSCQEECLNDLPAP